MGEQVYISVYTDAATVAELDAWASQEKRSRNNLMQLILANALNQRRAAQQAIEALEPNSSNTSSIAGPNRGVEK